MMKESTVFTFKCATNFLSVDRVSLRKPLFRSVRRGRRLFLQRRNATMASVEPLKHCPCSCLFVSASVTGRPPKRPSPKRSKGTRARGQKAGQRGGQAKQSAVPVKNDSTHLPSAPGCMGLFPTLTLSPSCAAACMYLQGLASVWRGGAVVS